MTTFSSHFRLEKSVVAINLKADHKKTGRFMQADRVIATLSVQKKACIYLYLRPQFKRVISQLLGTSLHNRQQLQENSKDLPMWEVASWHLEPQEQGNKFGLDYEISFHKLFIPRDLVYRSDSEISFKQVLSPLALTTHIILRNSIQTKSIAPDINILLIDWLKILNAHFTYRLAIKTILLMYKWFKLPHWKIARMLISLIIHYL